MTKASDHISFEEFSKNLEKVFERVIAKGESVVIQTDDGELVEIKPAAPAKSNGKDVTTEDDEAFLSAAGGWADVDIDAFLEDIHESRKSSRPRVDL